MLKPALLALAIVVLPFLYGLTGAYALPIPTFIQPTPQDNVTLTSNSIYINITSNEQLNQSILEWAYGTGFTNYAMLNSSKTNWYKSLGGLADGTYTYRVWIQNTAGQWGQSIVRYVTIDTSAPYELRGCQNLTVTNGDYFLSRDVSSQGTCFTIMADGISLDGRGHTLTYGRALAGYGVDNDEGHDTVKILNLKIAPGSNSYPSGAIRASGMANGVIDNNTMTFAGFYGTAINLKSSSANTISNNKINRSDVGGDDILLNASNSNTISGNTLTSSGDAVVFSVLLERSSSNVISNNVVASSAYAIGVAVRDSSNMNTILGNTFTFSFQSIGIDFYSSDGNSASGNTIVASGSANSGINVYSSSGNTLSENVITLSGDSGTGLTLGRGSRFNSLLNNRAAVSAGKGVYVFSASANTITGGSITSEQGHDYYLINATADNLFKNTDFSAKRKVYFYDIASGFNYVAGNIWLTTGVSARTEINRTVMPWSQSSLKWSDANTVSGIVTNYSISGLLPNKKYQIYNTSGATRHNPYTLTSDADGNLPPFTIFLDGNSGIEAAIYAECTESWIYSAWGGCVNGTQTRTAADSNNCGTNANRSELSQQCLPVRAESPIATPTPVQAFSPTSTPSPIMMTQTPTPAQAGSPTASPTPSQEAIKPQFQFLPFLIGMGVAGALALAAYFAAKSGLTRKIAAAYNAAKDAIKKEEKEEKKK